MKQEMKKKIPEATRQAEEAYLKETLAVIRDNIDSYSRESAKMQAEIKEMLERYHDNDAEVYTMLCNTVTLNEHMKRALERNKKAEKKPYFGRIIFHDETFDKDESVYIGKGGIAKDTTHYVVADWRAPVANVYYENGLGKCSYSSPDGKRLKIDLKLKRTYEIEDGRLLDYFDTEVVANDDLLTKYLARNKQAVLGEIIATIQKEQNEIIRKSPYHNIIVQGVAGSGKTTVAMHRISYILYNYQERFKPDDFYIVGSNRILLNYITGVLPDLDVYGIRQMTMEQLFVRLLYEDWDDKKYGILSTDKMDPGGCVKGTLNWFHDLERFCMKLEKDMIPAKTVFLNPRQFVEGLRDGIAGVFDETDGKTDFEDMTVLLKGEAIERYVCQNKSVSIQSKINMLNERLIGKVRDEFLKRGTKYTENERKAILKAYRGRFGSSVFKQSIFDLYQDFLAKQIEEGYEVEIHGSEFDVYDLAALAYLYKRVKETEVISEAHHIVIDEAQDFGMMAYSVLKFCIKDCTYTIMGDVSQNIHFGYGLHDWEELKELLLKDDMDSFGVLKKSYRNTVEISEFATNILQHGRFSIYPVEPIIRHGNPVQIREITEGETLIKEAAAICSKWQKEGLDTIAVVCRDFDSARKAAKELGRYITVPENDLESTVFGSGIMVLPVEYTKGLEFDAVLILDPDRKEYPVDDGHAKLLYVAATRALHELCILHSGNLTGLIADPAPKRAAVVEHSSDRQSEKAKRQVTSGTTIAPGKRIVIAKSRPAQSKPTVKGEIKQQRILPKPLPEGKSEQKKTKDEKSVFTFGDMPVTEKLRAVGHAKIDLAVRWVTKQTDGLYLQSRYGVLRLSPVGSAIIRVTFAKGQQILKGTNSKIAVNRTDNRWMYREAGKVISLMTDELCLQVDKSSGSISYLTRDHKLLLAERQKESRRIEAGVNGRNRTWLYLDFNKGEKVYGMGTQDQEGMNLRGSARYISHGNNGKELPFLISDNGYGILLAADGPAICCDVPVYGSYLYTEDEVQQDYYFISGKKQSTILNAYAYLCGKR